MSPDISAIILAGGLGSRMGEATRKTPKSMLLVEGRPVLTHILDGLQKEFGHVRVVIATGHRDDVIKGTYGNQYGPMTIEYLHDPRHLEVRRRLLLADGVVSGPFLVIGTDVLVDPKHYLDVATAFDTKDPDTLGVISGAVDLSPAPTHPLIYHKGGFTTGINYNAKPMANNGNVLRGLNLWQMDQRTLDRLRVAPDSEVNISPVLDQAIRGGARYMVTPYAGEWAHFGSPGDLLNNRVPRSTQK